MRTEGSVKRIEKEFAIVEIKKKSACEGCHKTAEGGCSLCRLVGEDRPMEVRAKNPLGAEVGDRVAVESGTGRMLFYALLVFVLPLLLAGIGFAVAAAVSEEIGVRIAGTLIGFFGTFLGLFIWSATVGKKRCDVTVTEILN